MIYEFHMPIIHLKTNKNKKEREVTDALDKKEREMTYVLDI